jgi:hypothetical protein
MKYIHRGLMNSIEPRFHAPPSPTFGFHVSSFLNHLHISQFALNASMTSIHHTYIVLCSQENYFLDDGAYSALKIVIEAAKRRLEGTGDVSSLLANLREPAEAMEIRVAIKAADVMSEGNKITAGFKEWVDAGAAGASHWRMEDENYEGWRVKVAEAQGKEGWVLVRPSLHDPGEQLFERWLGPCVALYCFTFSCRCSFLPRDWACLAG